MAALETKRPAWYAFFVEDGRQEAHAVEIVKTQWDHLRGCPYYWCTINTVGWWPGTESADWIEYVPDNGRLVERDDVLWWERDDGFRVHSVQVTARWLTEK